MARKSSAPAAPKPADPAPSDTSSGSSSEAESSEEPSPPPPNNPPPKSAAKAPIEEESSSGEEDDDDVSSDNSASDSAAAAAPVPPRPSAKPLDSPQKPPAAAAAAPVPPRPSAKPLASPQKPPAAAAASSDKKKRKAPEAPPPSPPQSNETGSGQKPQRFQRLWSKQDEITILRGMINHQAKTGALPSKTDMPAFRDSIQKNLTMDANVNQLSEKIRRLKSKYAKNPSASPAKPHDSAIHELAHKIWGASKALNGSGAVDAAEAADGGTARKHQKVKEEEGNAAYSANVKPRYTYLTHAITRMGDCLPCTVTMDEVLDFADNSKAMEIEEKLKKLWNLQLKNQIREMEMKKEAKKIVIEALHKMEASYKMG